jgi:D-tyrosyl-tRNA(Tyr) deacylase
VDVGGGALVVSQLTLYGDCPPRRRPSLAGAAPEEPRRWCPALHFADRTRRGPVEQGRFGAHMVVSIENDGPVTSGWTRTLRAAARLRNERMPLPALCGRFAA